MSPATFEAAVDAVVSGNLTDLTRLLHHYPELAKARSDRQHHATLLHYSGANGVEDERQKTPANAVQIAEALLQSGAEVDALADMYGGSTPLGLVATSFHPLQAGVQNALIEALLAHGALIDHPRNLINSCLANARIEAAQYLAGRGAAITLEGAAGIGHLHRVRELLTAASADEKNRALAWAAEYGRAEVVAFLLQQGLDIDAKLPNHGNTALHWAAYGAHLEIVKLLLHHKASVDPIDSSFSATPLGWAIHRWSQAPPQPEAYCEVVKLLVTHGGKPQFDPGLTERIMADPGMRGALNL